MSSENTKAFTKGDSKDILKTFKAKQRKSDDEK